jgi:hypothetical protein
MIGLACMLALVLGRCRIDRHAANRIVHGTGGRPNMKLAAVPLRELGRGHGMTILLKSVFTVETRRKLGVE